VVSGRVRVRRLQVRVGKVSHIPACAVGGSEFCGCESGADKKFNSHRYFG